MRESDGMDIYLEIGQKRTLAVALDWPGWARSGRDEGTALQTLLDYAPRYAAVAERAGIPFVSPDSTAGFMVTERLSGNATTDYGVPGMIPVSDRRPFDSTDLARQGALLAGCWTVYNTIAAAAVGLELRKGPRGGGRELEAITRHVFGAEQSYLSSFGWKMPKYVATDLNEEARLIRQAIHDGLAASMRGEIAERGPRGGVRWPARYFIRRVAWHVLDHAWEIVDRSSR